MMNQQRIEPWPSKSIREPDDFGLWAGFVDYLGGIKDNDLPKRYNNSYNYKKKNMFASDWKSNWKKSLLP